MIRSALPAEAQLLDSLVLGAYDDAGRTAALIHGLREEDPSWDPDLVLVHEEDGELPDACLVLRPRQIMLRGVAVPARGVQHGNGCRQEADADAAAAEQAEDEENRRLLDTIIAGGRVYLSGTILDDAFALRVSILSHRTHHRQIEDFFSELDRALNEVRPDTT